MVIGIKHRIGLRTLLKDVLNGKPGFDAILVYDVSRWGRFQDTDESAHYEFLCRNAGIQVHYCAEQFKNDGTLASSIMKALKRTMAAEFSRELGVKIIEAKKRLALLGFRMGAVPGYGLRRLMVTGDRKRIQVLKTGEYKTLTTNRVLLIHGPKAEVKCVQAIFSMILKRNMGITEIANHLNQSGIPCTDGKPWTNTRVDSVLRNPKYTGCNVWNQSTCKLHTRYRLLPRDEWAIVPGAFAPIIDQKTFDRVNAILTKRAEGWSDERLIRDLKRLLKASGKLTQAVIDRAPNIAAMNTYYAHFGSLRRIYELVGYDPSTNVFSRSDSRKKSLDLRDRLILSIENIFPNNTSRFHFPGRSRVMLKFDGSWCVSVLICPSFRTKSKNPRWKIYPDSKEREYITLLCLLDAAKTGFHSFIVMRDMDKANAYTLKEGDPWLSRGKRLNDLSELYDVSEKMLVT